MNIIILRPNGTYEMKAIEHLPYEEAECIGISSISTVLDMPELTVQEKRITFTEVARGKNLSVLYQDKHPRTRFAVAREQDIICRE